MRFLRFSTPHTKPRHRTTLCHSVLLMLRRKSCNQQKTNPKQNAAPRIFPRRGAGFF